jgi:FtsP/CotA-like multicopper oxidase with cupredoxin domain
VRIALAERASNRTVRGRKASLFKSKTKPTKMQPTTHYYELTASEFEWKLSKTKSVKAWGFNETIPGPVLRAKKGDTMIIKVNNQLNEPTIVHWHGIRLPASMDGTGEVQRAIQAGESFTYRFEVPDAGTFWYHSHQNETEQMERGMYGALIVEENSRIVTDAERVLMIDDMKLANDHSFKKGNFIGRWKERHDGREGNTLLINGKENHLIEMHEGQRERWRIINASSARYVRFYLGGRPFTLIGTDGGLIETPKETKEVLLIPGERIDIIVGPFNEGDLFYIESLPYDRMTFLKAKHNAFATVVVKEPKPSAAYIPARLREIKTLASQQAKVNRNVKFSVGASWKHGIDFLVNGNMHTNDAPVYVGDLQVWEVANTSLMDHPFHLHGFFFQVIEENGKLPDYKAWKDTYNLKPKSKVKIAWIPDNRPGRWMYHCHILEHHEAGMMAHFEVVDKTKGALNTPAPHSCSHKH